MKVTNCNCSKGTYVTEEIEPLTIPVMNIARDQPNYAGRGTGGASDSEVQPLVPPTMQFGREGA